MTPRTATKPTKSMTSSARPTGRSTLACFVWNPTVYYCNALTPAGKRMHFRAGHRAYATTRDWAERVAGLKVDRDLSGRGGRLKCRPR